MDPLETRRSLLVAMPSSGGSGGGVAVQALSFTVVVAVDAVTLSSLVPPSHTTTRLSAQYSGCYYLYINLLFRFI